MSLRTAAARFVAGRQKSHIGEGSVFAALVLTGFRLCGIEFGCGEVAVSMGGWEREKLA